ncbi:5-formyltetrahydrofolate cyclo-ligase [Herminiimonas fonticola]|uniref:5-formyltetrahydrofolate cyclo-ligase n=1 Tax=Herminiimonas fonticola TaxID=303380 RepID=A0A4R6GGM4_9BURK|nr:5-formyltetrahydrofolate cyclo-ligase [Herminiimonas fonticola]RBA24986.1 5-formyltetrahydrofolate cyclo-ligase [Herminiimonas fonticola]TDN94101.1 5,10-methenyltetrahydrofolate synthetase [Herminiimonas fonticola]
MQNKSELRQLLLTARNAITAEQKLLWDKQLIEKVMTCWSIKRFHTMGVYWPMRGEPDLNAAYATLTELGVQLALPVVVSDNTPLKFCAWTPGDPVIKDRYGAAVPADQHKELQPQALIIPCVGFNKQRFRLGYGGGFYDRTLASVPKPYTIGVAYANAETIFAADPYDVALDMVMTPTATFAQDHT